MGQEWSPGLEILSTGWSNNVAMVRRRLPLAAASFHTDWAVGSHPGPIRYTPSGPSGIPAHPDSIRIWPIRSGYVAKMGMLRLNIGSGMLSIGLGP